MKCQHCKYDNHPGARFCAKCGRTIQKSDQAAKSQACPKCGAANRTDVRFCKSCGRSLREADPPAENLRCPKCQAPYRPGVHFCKKCGQALQASPAAPAPAPKSPKKGLPHLTPAMVQNAIAAPGVKTCPRCKSQNPADMNFCLGCGAALELTAQPVAPQPDSHHCAKCGFENRPGAVFCKRCGAALELSPAAATPKAPPKASRQSGISKWFQSAGPLSLGPLRLGRAARWIVTLALVGLLAWWAVDRARQPEISQQKALDMSQQRILDHYPALIGIEPVITTNQEEGRTSYTIEYPTQNAAGLPSRLVFIIDGETGETLLLGSQ